MVRQIVKAGAPMLDAVALAYADDPAEVEPLLLELADAARCAAYLSAYPSATDYGPRVRCRCGRCRARGAARRPRRGTAEGGRRVTTPVREPSTVTPTGVVVAPRGLEREEWLALRRAGVGGSDVPAVLGMDRYRGPLEVYLDKLGELPDLPRDPVLDEAAFWGTTLEPVVAGVFAERTGLRVSDGPGTLAHVDRRWMLANLDRVVTAPGEATPSSLLEIKTRSAFQADEWAAGVPDGPALQTHWYLAVTGYSRAHVAALVGGQRLVVHRVERDEQLVAHLVDLVGDFWRCVQDRTPPPVDGSAATAELLGRLYDVRPDAVTLADPDEVLPLLDQLSGIKKRERQLADERRAVENHLKAIAGEAEVVQCRGETAFTWKQNGPLSAKQFRAEHPNLAEQYTHLVPALDTRRLAEDHPDTYRAHRARRLLVPTAKETV